MHVTESHVHAAQRAAMAVPVQAPVPSGRIANFLMQETACEGKTLRQY
jgi:hypothetical protein